MRENHWDAARAGLMLLIIPYHVAWLYGPPLDWADWLWWFGGRGERSSLLWIMLLFIHAFQMPAFFMIAGYFSAVSSAQHSAGIWLRRRLFRLGIPCVFGLAIIVPIGTVTRYMALWVKGEPASVVIAQAVAFYRSRHWLVAEHLWFLLVLIIYSLLFFAVRMSIRHYQFRRAIMSHIDSRIPHSSTAIFAMICLLSLAYFGTIKFAQHAWHIRQLAVFDIPFLWSAIDYFPYFVLGIALFALPALRAAFERFNLPVGLVALIGFALLLNRNTPGLVGWFAQVITALAATQLILACCARWAIVANPFVRTLADRSFTIYVIHVPIYYCLAVALIPIGMPTLLKFLLVTLATILSCYWLAGIAGRHPSSALLLGGDDCRTSRARAARVPSLA